MAIENGTFDFMGLAKSQATPSRVLLVEPRRSRKYHTPYPPLGLLKLATYHRQRGDLIRLVNGISDDGFEPDIIYITSLFTYAWEPVQRGCWVL